MNLSHRGGRGRLVAVACLAGLAVACASSGFEARMPASQGFPLTVENCGQEMTFQAPPRRPFANDINTAEAMVALGLADRMVGIAGVGGRDQVLPQLETDFRRIPRISDQYVELEALLGTGADFIYAGWNYGFSEASGLTPDTLAQHGIKAYALTESCAHVQPGKGPTSIEETFQDLRNLAAIFAVPHRAEELIAEMQQTLDEVAARVKGVDPRRVFVYDSGEDTPFTGPGLTIATDLIRRAGGRNIFDDLPATWTTVSWEQVIDRDPECILIVDYGETPWQQKRDFVLANPALTRLSAAEQGCFLPLTYAAITPGIRNAHTVREIAQLLHPTAL